MSTQASGMFLTPGPAKATLSRKTYGCGKDRTEVVLIVIEEGRHPWPGQQPPVGLISKSVVNVSANDLIWEFFQKHPMS